MWTYEYNSKLKHRVNDFFDSKPPEVAKSEYYVIIDYIKIRGMIPMTKYDILKQYFGYTTFRNGQEELIDSVLKGRDAIGIMPTGGGKSICYQVPALLFPGITVVISPLISLMKDQVMALKSAGVSAAFINSTLTPEQMSRVYSNIRKSMYKIIYIAPERLDTEFFADFASELNISLLAVDEAHCISQWGQDFRPSYLRIVDFLDKLPKRPVIAAFTATATNTVREDIERILELSDPVRIITGFDRPNLNFEVRTPSNKLTEVIGIVRERLGKSGIIYCATRNNVEKVCDALCEKGISATRYHAGLSDAEREKNQEDFIHDLKPVMVATNAFGMGINKSNVNYVVHYNMPMSLEAYYQEAGRAGRDGERADCILLFASGDIHTATRLIEMGGGNEHLTNKEKREIIIKDLSRLNRMVDYCRTTSCLRGFILGYFGQQHDERCENCGNCFVKFVWKDITVDAQKVLSCIKRAYDKLGYSVGKGLVISTLHGSKVQRLVDLGLDKLTTYGIMSEHPKMYIREVVEYLEENGYILTDSAYGGVLLSAKAREILFDGVKLEKPFKELPETKSKKPQKSRTENAPMSGELYEALRRLRFEIAQKEKMPAYIVFSNATLADMAAKKPVDMQSFLLVSGVGEVKAEKYGEIFIEKIKEYM